MRGRRRIEKEATVNGGIRSYLKENEWTKSRKVAARSNKEDEIHGWKWEERRRNEVRRIGGAVKLKTKETRSFNRAGPLRDKINRRKHFINGDEEKDDEERGARWRKKCSYVAMSLKNRDNNKVNATNSLKTMKRVKTEAGSRVTEREENWRNSCSGGMYAVGKRWKRGSMDSMMRFKLYFKRRARPRRISSREHRVASRRVGLLKDKSKIKAASAAGV